MNRPDYIHFDLDPVAPASFDRVCEAALLLNERLKASKVRSCAKTSGSREIHVYIPLRRDAPGLSDDGGLLNHLGQRPAGRSPERPSKPLHRADLRAPLRVVPAVGARVTIRHGSLFARNTLSRCNTTIFPKDVSGTAQNFFARRPDKNTHDCKMRQVQRESAALEEFVRHSERGWPCLRIGQRL